MDQLWPQDSRSLYWYLTWFLVKGNAANCFPILFSLVFLGFLRATTWLFSLTVHLFHSWPEPRLAGDWRNQFTSPTSIRNHLFIQLCCNHTYQINEVSLYHSTKCRWMMEYEMYSNLILVFLGERQTKTLHTPIPKLPTILPSPDTRRLHEGVPSCCRAPHGRSHECLQVEWPGDCGQKTEKKMRWWIYIKI